MKYCYRPRAVDAAQWDTGRPGAVVGLLADYGIEWNRDGDTLHISVADQGLALAPTMWVVVDGERIEVHTDDEFHEKFETFDARGGPVTNVINGDVGGGFVVQTGGVYHGSW